MSSDNEFKIHWKISNEARLAFYGLTKYPETKEFMMIIQFADKVNLRSIPSNNLNNIMWSNKINYLAGYCHKDFHSGNILRTAAYISDFGLYEPANEQKSDDKVAYLVGVIMAELSSGKPPFYNKKHDLSLSLAICNGLRPEFGKELLNFIKN
uniref:Uncharacterized protein n=1 Tax=Rhizophagus irregularis (strain DAOM 181602 / DAOM 197198 / MUCL 43194) TaxID=747089 RepID=U9UCB4_RHIID